MPDISVVIPVYNAEKYLNMCLESVLGQSLKNIEVILVNDGSMDNSLAICKAYAEEDERIIIIDQQNQGVSVARNAGKQKASGDYVIFVDSDDRLQQNMLAILLEDAKIHDADVVVCGIQKWSDEGLLDSAPASGEYELMERITALQIFLRNEKLELGAWNKLIKKTIVDVTDFYSNRRMNEDKFFCFEVLKKAKKIIYRDERLYCYYIRNSSVSYRAFDDRWFDNDFFCELIYETVLKECAELEKEARYQMLMSKYYLVLTLLREKVEKAYSAEYDKLIQDIRNIKIKDISRMIPRKSKVAILLIKYFMPGFVFYKKIQNR